MNCRNNNERHLNNNHNCSNNFGPSNYRKCMGLSNINKGCNCAGKNTFENECNCNKTKNNTKMYTENCGCDRGTECVDEMAPAMGYVPWQKWEDVYCIDDAIKHGTIFKELCKPFVGRCSK